MSEELRLQVLQIVREEFKNQDLVAITIADKAEDRLWRLGKILGLAASLAAAAFAVFGITSLEKARNQIAAAAETATSSLSTNAAATITRMQKQATITDTALADLNSRARTGSDRLTETEAALKGMQLRAKQLQEFQKKNPDTPIGKIDPKLFSLGGLGGYEPYGRPLTIADLYQNVGLSSPSTQPTSAYAKGSSGEGVVLLQRRLYELNCYKGEVSGQYDDNTASAVIDFSRESSMPYMLRPSDEDEAERQKFIPGPDVKSNTKGVVDRAKWQEIFAPSTKKCSRYEKIP